MLTHIQPTDMSCKKGADLELEFPLRLTELSFTLTQVRCDAASLGVPCTNCVAFQIECRIPNTKRKKAQNAAQSKDSDRYAYG
jgi:Fungal Zn(2)-Cys(6) binuclear cluster domain